MDKLECLCQKHYQDLLCCKKKLDNIRPSKEENLVEEIKSLPFFTSLLPLYERQNFQSLFLLEVNHQLNQHRQQKELKNICQVVSSLTVNGVHIQSPIEKWNDEMVDYCQYLKENTKACAYDQYFYNVSFNCNQAEAELDVYILSFCTRFRRKCLMMTVELEVNKSVEPHSFKLTKCQSSLEFENLSSDVQNALQCGVSAKEFVEKTLWKHLEEIANYN